MEECLLVEHRDKDGALSPFILKQAQAELHTLWEKIRLFNELRSAQARARGETKDIGVRIVAVKGRQVTVSTYVQARFFLEAMWVPNISVLTVAQLEKPAKNLLRKSHTSYRKFRPEMRDLRRPTDSLATDGISWKDHGSRFEVSTCDSDLSRSYTFQRLHLSEYGHYGTFKGVASVLDAVHGGAIVVESTANGQAGPLWTMWKKAKPFDEVLDAYERGDAEALEDWNGFFQFFFPSYHDPHYRNPVPDFMLQHILDTLDRDSRFEGERETLDLFIAEGLTERAGLQHLAWRRDKIREYEIAPDADGLDVLARYQQEHPRNAIEAFVAKGSKHFDRKAIDEIWEVGSKTRPLAQIELVNDYSPMDFGKRRNLRIYEDPSPYRFYSIGADVAEGINQDRSVCKVLDRCDGSFFREVADWSDATIPADVFADILCVMGELYNFAFITHEANKDGAIVSTRMIDNQYSRLYRREQLDVRKPDMEMQVHQVGFLSTGKTKPIWVAELGAVIRQKTIEIRTHRSIEEIREFEKRDGAYGAPEGLHDDDVAALGLGVIGAGQAPTITRKAIENMRKATGRNDPLLPPLPPHHEGLMAKLRASNKINKRVLGKSFRLR